MSRNDLDLWSVFAAFLMLLLVLYALWNEHDAQAQATQAPSGRVVCTVQVIGQPERGVKSSPLQPGDIFSVILPVSPAATAVDIACVVHP